MSISGNLRTMELSELLQWVSQGKKTGTLVIEADEKAKRLYFREGKIIASGTTMESEQLGHFLVSHGYITEPELDKAIAMQSETGMLLGKILVTIGGISEEELLELLVLKTEESVYDLFTWSVADFRFVENETLDRGMIPLALDVTALTLQGMNRLDEWSRIRKHIPSDNSIPVIAGELGLEERSAAEQHVLAEIDDQRTIREICHITHSSEFHVSRLVFRELLESRMKVVIAKELRVEVPATAAAHSSLQPSTVAEPPAPAPVVIDGEALCELGAAHLDGGRMQEGLRHLRAALVLDPRNRRVKELLAQGEERIRAHLRDNGLDLTAIPVLERSLEQLTDVQLSPEEGFLLTRIDGTNNVDSLLKISPMDRLQAELVFFKLMQEGHIRLRG